MAGKILIQHNYFSLRIIPKIQRLDLRGMGKRIFLSNVVTQLLPYTLS